MEAVFREVITEDRLQFGRTVLLSSHILGEVEALCDRVSIIRAGKIVESGTLADLRHLTRAHVAAELVSAPNGLSTLAGVHDLAMADHKIRFDVDTDRLNDVMARLTRAGLRSLTVQPPTLEELFLRHYRDDLAAEVS
jgi:ABC-2 type transport system ATP-binding protein